MQDTKKYIIYKKEVCLIEDTIKNYLNQTDYYLLSPITDYSLKIKIPTNNKDLRHLITKETLEKIIDKINSIEPININNKKMEEYYRELMLSGTHEDLIKIIKTTYLRNKERLDNNKKTTDKDNYYFNLAENYLYNEFSVVLNLSYEETKEYVINKVSEKL